MDRMAAAVGAFTCIPLSRLIPKSPCGERSTKRTFTFTLNMSVLRYAYLKISQSLGKRHEKNFARPDRLKLGLRCYSIIKVDVVTKLVFTLNL